MERTPPLASPMVPERTFTSTLHRLFDVPDPHAEAFLTKQYHVSRNASAVWGTSTSTSPSAAEDRAAREQRGKEGIALRRLKKAKSSLNLNSSAKNANVKESASNRNLRNAYTNPTSATLSRQRSRSRNVFGSVATFGINSSTLVSDPYTATIDLPSSTARSASARPTTWASAPAPVPAPAPTPAVKTNTSSNVGPRTTPTFELSPLSSLIQQSIKDIETMKRIHSRGDVNPGLSGARKGNELATSTWKWQGAGKAQSSNKMGVDGGGGREQGGMKAAFDFEKVEENLKAFEEVYRSFLETINGDGTPRAEVHLVAMVCKRSEVVDEKMGISSGAGRVGEGGGGGVPMARVADCCL